MHELKYFAEARAISEDVACSIGGTRRAASWPAVSVVVQLGRGSSTSADLLNPNLVNGGTFAVDPVSGFSNTGNECSTEFQNEGWNLFPNAPEKPTENKPILIENSVCCCLAGAGGIEPPNGGIKIRCLTAWLRPNRPFVEWRKSRLPQIPRCHAGLQREGGHFNSLRQ